MPSPTHKLAYAMTLSIAVHGLLFIPGESLTPQLSQRSIIHARLDKQDRELIQQEQVGQISQQHNEKISQPNSAAEETPEQPVVEEVAKPEEAVEAALQDNIISSTDNAAEKVMSTDDAVDTPAVEDVVEESVSQPQDNTISSDSRAQVEAINGSEDPTYTSYRRVLRQYLAQRLEAQPSLKGEVRLKIKLQYGSFATQVIVIKSSGDPQLDDWARKAALAANPYPKIPAEIGSTFEFSPTLQLGGSSAQ